MKQPSGWYGGFLKPLRNASTEADVESNYSKGVAYVTERYKNHKGAANIIKDRTKKFDLERTKALDRLHGKTTVASGAVTVPTLDKVYSELLNQGLKLVGINQQLSSSGQLTAPSTVSTAKKGSGGTLFLVIGGALAIFYFWKR